MADSDKNILITPNSGQTAAPKIEFTGADNNPVTLAVLDDGTISFTGSAGQLFSISDDLSGTIFSVNDVSGIPSIEVDDDGTVRIAEFSGNVLIGTDTDTGAKLKVDGVGAFTGLTVNGSNVLHTSSTGYNNSNWDTAYGWGNHASAGYLTSLPSHSHSYLPLSGGTLTGHINLGNYNISDVTDIYLDDQIISTGDTNTYMQFHAGDQWRVVTGGGERLEVNNSNTTVSNNLVCNGGINVGNPNTFSVDGIFRPHIPWAGNYFDMVSTTYFSMSMQGYLTFNTWDIDGMASDLTIDIDITYYDLSGGGSTVDHVFYFYVRNATSVSFPNCLLDSSVVAPSGTGLYAVCINSIGSPLVTMIGDYS